MPETTAQSGGATDVITDTSVVDETARQLRLLELKFEMEDELGEMEEAQRKMQRKMEKQERDKRRAFLKKAAAEGFSPDLFVNPVSLPEADKSGHSFLSFNSFPTAYSFNSRFGGDHK